MKIFYFALFIVLMILTLTSHLRKVRSAIRQIHLPKNHFKFIFEAAIITISGIVIALLAEGELVYRMLWALSALLLTIIFAVLNYAPICVTPTHIGKLWYARYKEMEYAQIIRSTKRAQLLFKRYNKKKSEVLDIPLSEAEFLKQHLKKSGVNLKKDQIV